MNELGDITLMADGIKIRPPVSVPLSIKQQTLAALERIEALLVQIAVNTLRRGK